jgi:hypothetical protein
MDNLLSTLSSQEDTCLMYLHYDYQNSTNQTQVNMAGAILGQATKKLSISKPECQDSIKELKKYVNING